METGSIWRDTRSVTVGMEETKTYFGFRLARRIRTGNKTHPSSLDAWSGYREPNIEGQYGPSEGTGIPYLGGRIETQGRGPLPTFKTRYSDAGPIFIRSTGRSERKNKEEEKNEQVEDPKNVVEFVLVFCVDYGKGWTL